MRFGDYELDTASRELRRSGEAVAMQPQVYDVLTYLIEHRDRMVTKAELLDEVWGTRFVTESALTSRIRSARKAIGDNGRDQALIKTIHSRGYRFIGEIETDDGRPDRPASKSGHKGQPGGQRSPRRHRVEKPLNSFVGREHDVAGVTALLEQHRLVSIVGPPGAGKSRLALEVAVDRNPVVVRLEQADDVVAAIANELGVLAEGDAGDADLLSVCAIGLDGSADLLVLDDCDQVIDDIVTALPVLLSLADDLHVLMTSRTALGAADEVLHALRPLVVSVDEESPAVELFTDRARQILPEMSFDVADMQAIERICRLLDGLPLAIELAAARLRHLTPVELERRIADTFDVLERTGPDDRHRTLEAAFAWSWDLLADDERTMLGQLAAVPDDLDLATVAVIGGPNTERLVLRLLDRSLLMTVPGPGDTRRYRLLQSLRHYVLSRIDQSEIDDARNRYIEHLAHWIPVVAEGVRRDDRADTVERAKSWRSATAGAIRASVDTDPARAARLAGALSVLVEQAGVDPTSMEAIVAAAESDAVLEAASPDDVLQIGHVCSSFNLGVMRRLGEWAERRSGDDPTWELTAAGLNGWCHAVLGRTDEALTALDRAAELAAELGRTWEFGSALQGRGVALGAAGRAREAIDAFGEAAEAYAAVGDGLHVNNVRYMAARVASEAGIDLDAAVRWIEQCLDYSTAVGNDHELAHALQVRARLPGCEDVEGSIRYAMTVFRRVGDLRCIIRSNLALAELRPEGERVDELAAALQASVTANDPSRTRNVGGLLITDLCAADRTGDAAMVWGALDREPEAPPELADRRWNLMVVEGSASGPLAVLERLSG